MSMSGRLHVGLNLGSTDEITHTQAENAVFGFWVFLMSDAVIFALLFATYGTMVSATAGGPTPAGEFKIGAALSETLILLTSSFTLGMVSIAMKYQEKGRGVGRLLAWLGVTLALGSGFLGMELHDCAMMFGDGARPGRSGFCPPFSRWCLCTACTCLQAACGSSS